MGLFRSFFGRKPAAPPEVWTPAEPRAGLGLPPIEIPGRVEPGTATPGGYRPAYREDIEIPPPRMGERWAPEWADDQEFDAVLPDGEPEVVAIEPPAIAQVEAEAPVEEADQIAPVPEPELEPEVALDSEPELVAAETVPEPATIAAPAEPEAPAPPAILTPTPDPLPAARPKPDIRSILAEIETLGDSPELGLLRQALGAGMDGLFGFSTMYPAALITLLNNRFAGTGELKNLSTRAAWGHYYIADKRYGFSWKSDIQVDHMDDAAVLSHESRRLIGLRDQLIDHLTGNQRLFVYAGPATYDQIADIRAAMRSYGTNTLLHLVTDDAGMQPGQVVWRQEGLLRGALSRYGSKDGRWDIARDDWIAACLAAHQRWKPFARP